LLNNIINLTDLKHLKSSVADTLSFKNKLVYCVKLFQDKIRSLKGMESATIPSTESHNNCRSTAWLNGENLINNNQKNTTTNVYPGNNTDD